MSTVIHCPDCGGVVGATQVTDAGPPCRCFGGADLNGNGGPPDPSGTQVLDSPATQQKICCRCGKDLNGKKRLRDSEGYWCVDCHRADKREHLPSGVRCPSCGRTVAEDSLSNYDGERICNRCVKEKRELKKATEKKFKVVDGQKFDAYEKKQALIILAILGTLALVIALRWLGFLGGN
jgi:hypothetical protein